MLMENRQRYVKIMSNYNEKEKEKNQPDVTKNHNNSIIITTMSDIPPEDSYLPGIVHVILGITRWLVKVKIKAYRMLEEL